MDIFKCEYTNGILTITKNSKIIFRDKIECLDLVEDIICELKENDIIPLSENI